MKQLSLMGDDIPCDVAQRLAYVLAENSAEAIEAALRLGIDPPEDRCVEVSHPKRTPEIFVGRLLSDADREELYQIRQRAQQGEAVRQLNAGKRLQARSNGWCWRSLKFEMRWTTWSSGSPGGSMRSVASTPAPRLP
jgi:hypothetical protein